MIHKVSLPSQNDIAARLDYDPETGVFTWLPKPGTDWRTRAWNTLYAGQPAGRATERNSIQIRFDAPSTGRRGDWAAHRLAFVAMTGREPADEIDHIDRDPSNNAWSNLRQATHAQNNMNRRLPKSSTTGIKGVSLRGNGTYEAHVKVEGKKRHCGYWASAQDAGKCARIVRQFLHGAFASHR